MTDQTTEENQPRADIRKRGFSLIWLVPMVAVGIVAWLGWQHFASHGPTITIQFQRGEGLEAGKTQIKNKSVPVGIVKTVALSKDLSHVIVTAEMDKVVDGYLGKDAKFWVVRPRFSAGNISGLDTLVSGSYIVMRPAKGEAEDQFKGLENPPVDVQDTPGRRYTLHTNELRAIDEGSSIYYRGIEAGTVLGYKLNEDGQGIEIYIFIRDPYAKFVTTETRFWNASGVSVTPTINGIDVKMESLRALIAGGLTFDTPQGTDMTPAPVDSSYRLYDTERDAQADPRGPHFAYTINFPGVVHSLNIDAPVELMGIHVGRVTGIDQYIDAKTGAVTTPVTVEIEQDLIHVPGAPKANSKQGNLNATLDAMIRHGVRAELASGSLLTGLKFVQLQQTDDAPPAKLILGGKYPEIPSSASGSLDDLTQEGTKLLKHVDEVVGHADIMVDNLNKLTGSGQGALQDTVKSLDGTVKDLDRVLNNLDTDVRPLGTQLPQLLIELKNTARSATSLLDYVDRHPESLILGRTAASSSSSSPSDTSNSGQTP